MLLGRTGSLWTESRVNNPGFISGSVPLSLQRGEKTTSGFSSFSLLVRAEWVNDPHPRARRGGLQLGCKEQPGNEQ